jgi:hypothetical protein
MGQAIDGGIVPGVHPDQQVGINRRGQGHQYLHQVARTQFGRSARGPREFRQSFFRFHNYPFGDLVYPNPGKKQNICLSFITLIGYAASAFGGIPPEAVIASSPANVRRIY